MPLPVYMYQFMCFVCVYLHVNLKVVPLYTYTCTCFIACVYSTYEIKNTVCKYVAQTVSVIQDAHTPVNQDYSETQREAAITREKDRGGRE